MTFFILEYEVNKNRLKQNIETENTTNTDNAKSSTDKLTLKVNYNP